MPKYLTRIEASEYLTGFLGLPLKANTLARFVVRGGGPRHYRFGKRTVYLPDDLRSWAEARLIEHAA